jgi:hypothetical protein
LKNKAIELGATRVLPLNHGNALSVHFADPEGNTVEIYVDMPFYIAQPHGDPFRFRQRRCNYSQGNRNHLPKRSFIYAYRRMAEGKLSLK